MRAENDTLDTTKEMIKKDRNNDDEWSAMRAEHLIKELIKYYNSCNRQYSGYQSEGECQKGCEAQFPEIKGYDRPNCSTLASILLQTDHPIDAQYFLSNSSPTSKWLPLTETEKIIMEYGKNLDHNRGGNEVVFFEDEPVSSCYFRGVKFTCTFSNFLGALTDLNIESFVRFPAKIRSQAAQAKLIIYTLKTFRIRQYCAYNNTSVYIFSNYY